LVERLLRGQSATIEIDGKPVTLEVYPGMGTVSVEPAAPRATCGPDHHAPGGIISTGGGPFRCVVCDQVLGVTEEKAREAFDQPPTGGGIDG
jgi:hypothetical protein